MGIVDIKVTGIEPAYVKEVERKAEEISDRLGKKISRNEYIKMLIQNDCELRLMKLKEDKFDQAVMNLSISLDNHDKRLQEFIDSNNRLFHLLASGIDITEGVDEI